jgi:hypothetical protein
MPQKRRLALLGQPPRQTTQPKWTVSPVKFPFVYESESDRDAVKLFQPISQQIVAEIIDQALISEKTILNEPCAVELRGEEIARRKVLFWERNMNMPSLLKMLELTRQQLTNTLHFAKCYEGCAGD